MAQPRSQRDAARNAGGGNVNHTFHDPDSRTPTHMTVPFIQQQQQQANQMPMPMMYQRAMGQVPMMGGIGMMNPMMGMGMGGMNPMANMMGMGMGMGGMGGMNGMGMGGMRMGMNAMPGMGGMGAMTGMNGMDMNMAMRGAMNQAFARGGVNPAGPGPVRMTNRGQHNFHPYSR
jgi:RNA-binding protein Musashi